MSASCSAQEAAFLPKMFSPVIAAEQLPTAKTLSTGSKRFFFDIFSNERGVCVMNVPPCFTFDLDYCAFSYLRVSELGASNQVSACSFYTQTLIVSHADARLFCSGTPSPFPKRHGRTSLKSSKAIRSKCLNNG
jgi:hypothetical protein